MEKQRFSGQTVIEKCQIFLTAGLQTDHVRFI